MAAGEPGQEGAERAGQGNPWEQDRKEELRELPGIQRELQEIREGRGRQGRA